jgi:hypothetical protein
MVRIATYKTKFQDEVEKSMNALANGKKLKKCALLLMFGLLKTDTLPLR